MFLILDLQSLLLKARKLHQNKFIFGRNFWDFKIIVKSDKQSILNTSHTLNSFEAKMGSCSLQFYPTPTIVFHTKLQDWQILFLPSKSFLLHFLHSLKFKKWIVEEFSCSNILEIACDEKTIQVASECLRSKKRSAKRINSDSLSVNCISFWMAANNR